MVVLRLPPRMCCYRRAGQPLVSSVMFARVFGEGLQAFASVCSGMVEVVVGGQGVLR